MANLQIAHLLFAKGGEVFESLDGFDEGKIAAGHHGQGAFLQVLRRGRTVKIAGALALPKIPPNGYQLNAEPACGATTGEKNAAAIYHRVKDNLFDAFGAPRLDKGSVFFDYIFVD